jgi:hypothetical protein
MKRSWEFQLWGSKVLKISNSVDEILSRNFQFWRWNVAGFWEFDLVWISLQLLLFLVFVVSFSTTIGFHLANPSCPPFAENVIYLSLWDILHHYPPFQTLITTKGKETKRTIGPYCKPKTSIT